MGGRRGPNGSAAKTLKSCGPAAAPTATTVPTEAPSPAHDVDILLDSLYREIDRINRRLDRLERKVDGR